MVILLYLLEFSMLYDCQAYLKTEIFPEWVSPCRGVRGEIVGHLEQDKRFCQLSYPALILDSNQVEAYNMLHTAGIVQW